MGKAVEEEPTAAFILSLVGGILTILGALFTVGMASPWRGMMHSWGFPMGGGMMWWGGGFIQGVFLGMGILGLIFGIVVVISALLLNSNPGEHTKWGTLILIFSLLSIMGGMGGWLIGLILGVVGGVLAITWKPSG